MRFDLHALHLSHLVIFNFNKLSRCNFGSEERFDVFLMCHIICIPCTEAQLRSLSFLLLAILT